MKLEKSLYLKSWIYFIVFFLFVLWGFWNTYFTRLTVQPNYRMHLHGLALIAWCLLLILQPYLVRSRKLSLHKKIGRFSYVLVPILVITTVDLLKYKLAGKAQLGSPDYFFIALVLLALLSFLIVYGLAIYNKRKGPVHARYMLSTAFPMFTPITDRIVHIYFPSWLRYLPVIDGKPVAPVVGFVLADILLLGLCIWDWRSHRRWNIFPFVLLLLLAYHFSVLNFYKYLFWIKFCGWFASL